MLEIEQRTLRIESACIAHQRAVGADHPVAWNDYRDWIFADRLVKGEAGQIYGGLNSQTVIKAFTDYISEKAGEIVTWRTERAAEQGLGDFGAARSSETRRLKDQQTMKLYLSGTLEKDIKKD